ncbi:hypothetical protein C5F59_025320 [Streptomyces sp. QL37]|uniref:hypothetical protein n=1 Tax=Streptomyces sp. QL37 TaxID=2093747 RepID=UPI000CF284BE|nr:hypothetical protein [Streptomyces sp. QL37]PPQ57523.1 hypothetical protein C5F59_13100 [Streptomyces sp. QL37]
MNTEERRAAAARIEEAEAAREDLRDALDAAGVKLPSLRLDIPSLVGPMPQPLVDLGRCNLSTTRQLTAVLRQRRTELLVKVREANKQSTSRPV